MNLRPSIPAGCSTGPRPGNPSSIAESSDSPKTVWTHHGSFYSPGTKLCSLQSFTTGTYFWRRCATNL